MTKIPTPLIGAAYDALKVVVERVEDKQTFLGDPILQDATLMRLIEAGEYLARLRDSYPDFYEGHHSDAWNRLIGLRNIIAHGYVQVDREKVWDIVNAQLPGLITELERLL